MMGIGRLSAVFLVLIATAFGQSDRGTITGTVQDPGGAVIGKAPLEARNVETGSIYQVATSETGNYAFPQLPAGTYELIVTVPGFKRYTREKLVVGVAQTLRVDIAMEIGAAAESVTVTESTSLLKTESGELSHNVETKRLIDLPVLSLAGANGGSGAIRNPLAAAQTIPGASQSNVVLRVNGAPANSQSIRIDGQETNNAYFSFVSASIQPSVDAVQEVSIQTSNFAAEYGQVGGGVFNFTMRGGTNQFHGSAFDYFRNEALEAGAAWSDNGKGGHVRPVNRQHNYGFSFGGPVWIPKVYDGKNKTFFFLNMEKFRQRNQVNTTAVTVPTAAFRGGDFSTALTGRRLNTDSLGRPILENTIYDPATGAAGSTNRDPFPGNRIPLVRMDPISLKLQTMIPAAANGNAVNNLILPFGNPSDIAIPSLKLDQSLGTAHKLSFFWTRLTLENPQNPGTTQNNQGLPLPISSGVTNSNASYNIRLNYDYTIGPSLLLHLGGGYQTYAAWNTALSVPYDAAKELGLKGVPFIHQFPSFTGLLPAAAAASIGGMENMGPSNQQTNSFLRPSSTASVTWVKSNHSYRFGGEFRTEGVFRQDYSNTSGAFQFSGNETSLPSTVGQNLAGGTVGIPYASFLLGAVDSVTAAMPAFPRIGKHEMGVFAQDTWKVTRTFTLDYGLRYDYGSYYKEQYGRLPNFSPTTPNPIFGGRLGAPIYEGSGPGRCDCQFAKNYPFQIGPRLGFAFQITPKTVLRGGFGIVYAGTNVGGSNTAVGLAASGSTLAANSLGVFQPVTTLSAGIPITPVWPTFDPSRYPFNSAPTNIDPNAGRPARQFMWSLGLQRQLWRNMAVEASYVGNRGTWWQANALNQLNGLGQGTLQQLGLDITSAADRTLLTSTVASTTAISRGIRSPYTGFPTTQLVGQALRPFPQYGTITSLWAPIGNTWYDSLQVKATQRVFHGLDFTYAFTWQKDLDNGTVCEQCLAGPGPTAVVTDPFNRGINKQLSAYSQPLVSVIAANYTTPRLQGNRVLSLAARDWLVGAFLNYSSGMPIRVPQAQNALVSQLRGVAVNSSRVPGAPLFTKDLNCHCFDPGKEFVLNASAWQDPPAGYFGTAASYYNDYRYQRTPQENAALSRTFVIKERVRMLFRVEMSNVLNRLRVPQPTATNALATPVRTASGVTQSGFGRIETLTPGSGQRSAQALLRLTF